MGLLAFSLPVWLSFFPELAKDNIRVIFDYQQPDGMIIDCIYPDAFLNNNYRDSKPPALAAWAVNEIYEHTQDLAFVKENVSEIS